MPTGLVRGLAGLLVVIATLSGNARAEVEVLLTVKPPNIEATVIGAPRNLPMKAYALVDRTAAPPIVLTPTRMLGTSQGHETIALAIVMSGWEMWIGNDKEVPEVRPGDPSRYPGILVPLRAAIDKVRLKDVGPVNSVYTLITYTARAKVRVPMSPLAELAGKRLGTQKDYFMTIGIELVEGVKLGLAELAKRHDPRKVLIVIGDGNDTDNDTARARLAALKKQAAVDHVKIFAITYKAKLSNETDLFPLLTPNAVRVTPAQIEGALRDVKARLDDRKYLSFPATKLRWDGKPHDFVLQYGGKTTEPVTIGLIK